MSQPALNQYLKRLKPGGTLIFDPEYVTQPDRTGYSGDFDPGDCEAGRDLGNKLVANMYRVGFYPADYRVDLQRGFMRSYQ